MKSPPERKEFSPRSILLVKPSSLGDIVNTLPALAALRRGWPAASIDWLVKPEWTELLHNHPMLHDVVTLPGNWKQWMRFIGELRRRHYDMVIDFQGLLRSGLLGLVTQAAVRVGFADGREGSPWCYTHSFASTEGVFHAVERYLDLIRHVGVATDGRTMFPLPRWRHAESWVDALWQSEKIGPEEVVCVVHPAARWATKRWPAERYAQLADWMLSQKGCRVMLIGGSGQIKQLHEVKRQMRRLPIDLAGRTNLQQLTALLRKAMVVVTNDSGPMHLSAAVGTPVVAVFGRTDPRQIGPYGLGHVVLQGGIDCSGCGRHFCKRRLACLKAISVDQVCRAVETQVRRRENCVPLEAGF